MQIGDTIITRDQMPTMQMWQMNPNHTEQGIQDILDMALGSKTIQNPQTSPEQMGLQGTSEIRNDVWNGGQK